MGPRLRECSEVVQGLAKRLLPGLVNMRRKNCVFLPAAGRKMQFFTSYSRSLDRTINCTPVQNQRTTRNNKDAERFVDKGQVQCKRLDFAIIDWQWILNFLKTINLFVAGLLKRPLSCHFRVTLFVAFPWLFLGYRSGMVLLEVPDGHELVGLSIYL